MSSPALLKVLVDVDVLMVKGRVLLRITGEAFKPTRDDAVG
jgi:hypothetical protein